MSEIHIVPTEFNEAVPAQALTAVSFSCISQLPVNTAATGPKIESCFKQRVKLQRPQRSQAARPKCHSAWRYPNSTSEWEGAGGQEGPRPGEQPLHSEASENVWTPFLGLEQLFRIMLATKRRCSPSPAPPGLSAQRPERYLTGSSHPGRTRARPAPPASFRGRTCLCAWLWPCGAQRGTCRRWNKTRGNPARTTQPPPRRAVTYGPPGRGATGTGTRMGTPLPLPPPPPPRRRCSYRRRAPEGGGGGYRPLTAINGH